MRSARYRRQRGVSLVEAIVAMAVMAFGMLAIVGLQATMRLNADVAKQRSEAVRIAQEAIEDWRGFSTIPTTPLVRAFADIASAPGAAVNGYTTNTTYTLTRTVKPEVGQNAIRVDVSWDDRAGQTQSVSLSSVIAAADPALSGVLSIKPTGKPAKMPMGRNAVIPRGAVQVAGGSAFRPSDAPGSAVVWLFDNTSGIITDVCTHAGLLTDLNAASCTPAPSLLISGYVRFSYSTPANALNPTDTQKDLAVSAAATLSGNVDGDCYVDPLQSPLATFTFYRCRVPTNAGKWTGRTTLTTPLDLSIYDVCRYSTGLNNYDTDPDLQAAYNIDHPAEYKNLDRSLPSQNFLVVSHGTACPSVAPALTQAHQPPP